MVNFMLGTVAGGIIASVVTIAVVRHIEDRTRVGFTTPATLTASPPTPGYCVSKPATAQAGLAPTGKLFEPRRFWFVAP